MLNDKVILLTGGTGSFGKAFTKYVLNNYNPQKIIIYSRDEFKQFIMQNDFKKEFEERIAAAKKKISELSKTDAAVDLTVPSPEFIRGNLYGGTKLVSDKLFIAANAYAGNKDICFSIVRYGNVAGSRGSVIPFFKDLIEKGEKELPITDFRMTRFWISLDEG